MVCLYARVSCADSVLVSLFYVGKGSRTFATVHQKMSPSLEIIERFTIFKYK